MSGGAFGSPASVPNLAFKGGKQTSLRCGHHRTIWTGGLSIDRAGPDRAPSHRIAVVFGPTARPEGTDRGGGQVVAVAVGRRCFEAETRRIGGAL